MGNLDKMFLFATIQTLIQRCMRANVYDWLIHSEDFDLASEMAQFTAIVLNGLKTANKK